MWCSKDSRKWNKVSMLPALATDEPMVVVKLRNWMEDEIIFDPGTVVIWISQ